MYSYYFPIILSSAFERLPQPHSSSKSEGPLLPVLWQFSSMCYFLCTGFKCLFSEYKHIFFVGEWLPEGPTVLHPSRRALSFNLSLYYVNIKLLLSLGLSPHLLRNFLIHFVFNTNMPVLQTAFSKSRMRRGKLQKVITYFPLALRPAGQGDSGLSKRWMPWSDRLSHSDRMVSWIQGTWWVSRYVW